MGAVNHQPCRHYLPISTKLSRALSVSRAKLEEANVAFEDQLLIEMDGGTATVSPIIEKLRESMNGLSEFRTQMSRLIAEMNRQDYQDLPPLRRMNLEELGCRLMMAEATTPPAWTTITQLAEEGGFRRIFHHFDEAALDLHRQTKDLMVSFACLEEDAKRDELELTLEENRSGNVRLACATLYAAHNNLSLDFAASALLSAEVWYAFCGHGSMVGGTHAAQVA